MKLVMVKIGARPKGRLIEQHDIIFAAVNTLPELIPLINQAWPEVKQRWHIDAWREVTRVDDFAIRLIDNTSLTAINDADKLTNKQNVTKKELFFINLGGYLPDQFEEYHYKMLVVADTLAKAKARARKTSFYQDYNLINSNPDISGVGTSHIDDKFAIDIDEIHAVTSLLPPAWQLAITPISQDKLSEVPTDTLHIGYLSLKQLKTLHNVL